MEHAQTPINGLNMADLY